MPPREHVFASALTPGPPRARRKLRGRRGRGVVPAWEEHMPDDRPLSPAAAARYIESEWHLKVHPETVRRWVRRGALPATKTPSGYLLIDPADLHAVFEPTSATGDDD